ncbi:MAG: hypothetical protein NZL89_00945, partial [Leptospiraceae bacterium]|nr:hypothetical protein [Leptospiraceae bacterium]
MPKNHLKQRLKAADNLWVKAFFARLSVRAKLTLAAGLLFLPLAFLGLNFWLVTTADIVRTRMEIAGARILPAIHKVIYHVQRRRGFTTLHRANTDKSKEHAEESKAVSEAMAALQLAVQQNSILKLDAATEVLAEKLKILVATQLESARKDHINKHTERIQDLLELIAELSEKSQLNFEPEPFPYYLMEASTKILPILGERLGQLRFLGTQLLAEQTGDLMLLGEIMAIYGSMLLRQKELQTNLQKIIKYSNKEQYRQLQKDLEVAQTAFDNAWRKAFRGRRLEGQAFVEEYFNVATRLADAY